MMVYVLLLLTQALPVHVQVDMKDGNSVTGKAPGSFFMIETSLGTLTIEFKDVKEIVFGDESATVKGTDGNIVRGKIQLKPFKIKSSFGEITINPSDVKSITVKGVFYPKTPFTRRALRERAKNKAKPPPLPPAPKGLAPVKTIELDASIPRTARSKDGKKIYALNTTLSSLLVIDVDSFAVESEIPLPKGAKEMSLAPSEKILVAGGEKTLIVISLEKKKVLRTFTVEHKFRDVCALNDDFVLASTNSGLLTISLPKQAITQRYQRNSYWRLGLSNDGERVYTGDGMILLPLDDLEKGYPVVVKARGRMDDLVLSPDGRHGVKPVGQVYRLGKSHIASMLQTGQIDVFQTCAWAPGAKRLYAMISTGFVKEYDSETFQLQDSWFLGHVLTQAYVDDEGKFLYGYGKPGPGRAVDERGSPKRLGHIPQPGHFYKFTLP